MNALFSGEGLRGLAKKGALISLAGFVFLYPLVHNAAGKNIFAALMILSLLTWVITQPALFRTIVRHPGWAMGSVFALFGVATLSALLSSDPESLRINGKELGFQMIAALLAAALAGDGRAGPARIRILTLALAMGLAWRAILVIYEHSPEWETGPYTGGYATMAAMVIPVVLAMYLAWPWSRAAKVALALFVLTACWLVIDYPTKSRAALFSLLAGVLVMMFVARQWRYILFALLLACAGVLAVSQLRPGMLGGERYAAVFQSSLYGSEGSAGIRFSIWAGIGDLIEKQPWLGYGPGWKKLPAIAKAGGFIERWRSSDDPLRKGAADYFSMSEGKVNPHSLYFQVLFETGIAGLVALLSLAAALLVTGWRSLRSRVGGQGDARLPSHLWFGMASTGFVTSWLTGGFANGFWSELTPLFMLAGVAWAVQRNPGLPDA